MIITPAVVSDLHSQIQGISNTLQNQIDNPAGYTRQQVSAARTTLNYMKTLAQMVDAFTPLSGNDRYIVASFETIFQIAQKYLGDATKYDQIMALNHLTSMVIPAGTELILPSPQGA